VVRTMSDNPRSMGQLADSLGRMTHTRPGRISIGFQAQLLVLLLTFGLAPSILAVSVGLVVSRAVILEQTERGLVDIANREASLISTELHRQRLLLRTITGQLSARETDRDPADLAPFLRSSLQDEGVFDGLRLVTRDGRVLADVALGYADPRWPEIFDDASESSVALHYGANGPIAYMLSETIPRTTDTLVLIGHVAATDFENLLGLGVHPLGMIEQGLFDTTGRVILVPHAHATDLLRTAWEAEGPSSVAVIEIYLDGDPALVFTSSVPEVGWTLVVAMPTELALASITRLRSVTFAGMLALAIAIVGTAHFVAAYVTRPIHELATAAQDFGQTGLYQAVRHRGIAETEALVTAFNEMAGDLSQSREEIERMHHEEMERAQQLATVGELASGVAHEIRNPLTGVLGALELARQRVPDGDDAEPLLEESMVQLHRIEDATARLLQYARPPALQAVVVDPNLLVERAMTIVSPKADTRRVQLHTTLCEGNAAVNVDPELLVQVIVNIMLNAIDAVDTGGTVTTTAALVGSTVRIAISDTGPGITEDQRDQIFRPFYTTKHRGTGLGLPISQQIIMRHGGQLVVEAAPSGGASFVITLPTVQETEASHA